jgi:hypothetical protein
VCQASSVNPTNAKAKPHKVLNSDREQQQHKAEGEGSAASAGAECHKRKAAEYNPVIFMSSISSRTQLGIVIELFYYYEVLSSRSIQN